MLLGAGCAFGPSAWKFDVVLTRIERDNSQDFCGTCASTHRSMILDEYAAEATDSDLELLETVVARDGVEGLSAQRLERAEAAIEVLEARKSGPALIRLATQSALSPAIRFEAIKAIDRSGSAGLGLACSAALVDEADDERANDLVRCVLGHAATPRDVLARARASPATEHRANVRLILDEALALESTTLRCTPSASLATNCVYRCPLGARVVDRACPCSEAVELSPSLESINERPCRGPTTRVPGAQ